MKAAEPRAERLDAMLSESIQAMKSAERRIAELEIFRFSCSQVFTEIGQELGCNPDNESIMIAIDDLKKRLATPIISSPDSDTQRENFGCSVRTTDSGTFYITKLGSVPGREMALYRNEAEALFIGLREALSAVSTSEGGD